MAIRTPKKYQVVQCSHATNMDILCLHLLPYVFDKTNNVFVKTYKGMFTCPALAGKLFISIKAIHGDRIVPRGAVLSINNH